MKYKATHKFRKVSETVDEYTKKAIEAGEWSNEWEFEPVEPPKPKAESKMPDKTKEKEE